jgi:hypothetical protein
VCSLIVVFLRSATGRCGLIRPPGCKLRPLSYAPSPKILSKIPFKKRRRHAIPRPFPPAPTRSPVDCDVVGRWHQAEQSKSSAWCQNGPCCPPPRTPKIHRFPPSKSEAAMPSPGCFSPRQRGLQLIVMSLGGVIKRNSRNRPPIAIRPGYQTPRLPRFCPNCVAAGLTLRLTRTAYQKSGVANEAQGDGLSGDASSSL